MTASFAFGSDGLRHIQIWAYEGSDFRDALLAFLKEQGVSLPSAEGEAPDIEDGIPEAMQQAVVPVICHAD